MTKGLVRYYGNQDLHFITCSCYRRQPNLKTAKRRDLFLNILEETRCKYRFVVHGYVIMPEHFHLLITEPDLRDPSVVMKVIKQRFAPAAQPAAKKAVLGADGAGCSTHARSLRMSGFRPVERGLVAHTGAMELDTPPLRNFKILGNKDLA